MIGTRDCGLGIVGVSRFKLPCSQCTGGGKTGHSGPVADSKSVIGHLQLQGSLTQDLNLRKIPSAAPGLHARPGHREAGPCAAWARLGSSDICRTHRALRAADDSAAHSSAAPPRDVGDLCQAGADGQGAEHRDEGGIHAPLYISVLVFRTKKNRGA